MKRFFALSIMVLLTLSCEKVIEYDLPREGTKLALDARIITGEPVNAFVSISEFVLDTENPEITGDATLELYENGIFIENLAYKNNLTEHEEPQYVGNHIIEPGNIYRIEASHPEVESVSGEDETRDSLQFDEVKFDTAKLSLDLTFTDPPSQKDFYSITVWMYSNNNKQQVYMSTFDPFVEFLYGYNDPIGGEGKYGAEALLSDENINGKTYTIRFEELSLWGEGQGKDTLLIELARISGNYYRHERSKEVHINASGNPFAEPVPIYSNVKNGYGIVAAKSVSREYFVY